MLISRTYCHIVIVRPPASCSDLVEQEAISTSGIYTIFVAGEEVTVWCDMETLGGGWTVLQRRGDFGQDTNYFLKGWDKYKNGFGDPEQVRETERARENY